MALLDLYLVQAEATELIHSEQMERKVVEVEQHGVCREVEVAGSHLEITNYYQHFEKSIDQTPLDDSLILLSSLAQPHLPQRHPC